MGLADARYFESLSETSQPHFQTRKGGPTFVVVDGLEHLLGCDQKVCHLPHGHFEVHLGKFEEPISLISTCFPLHDIERAYLLKKRGIRISDPRRSANGPKLPPYWRGVAILGLLMDDCSGAIERY